MRTGQTHVCRHLKPTMDEIERGGIGPLFPITRRFKPADAPSAHKTFRQRADEGMNVVRTP